MPSDISSNNLILFGGGVDSACLAQHLSNECIPFDLLSIDYGQKAWAGEYHASTYFAKRHHVHLHTSYLCAYSSLTHPMLKHGKMAKQHNDNVLPLRNQTLLDEAVRFAIVHGYGAIYLGFHVEPTASRFFDAMPDFVDAYKRLLDVQRIDVDIKTPFQSMTKDDYLDLITDQDLRNTFSCYESQTITECGRCTHCQQKKEIYKRKSAGAAQRRD